MQIDKLRTKIIRSRMRISSIAELIGITTDALYYKLHKRECLTIGEVLMLKDILGLTDEEATEIFLDRR